jgi:hypothetical protein
MERQTATLTNLLKISAIEHLKRQLIKSILPGVAPTSSSMEIWTSSKITLLEILWATLKESMLLIRLLRKKLKEVRTTLHSSLITFRARSQPMIKEKF